MIGEGMLLSGQRIPMRLFLAGTPPLDVNTRVLRHQLGTRKAECVVIFQDLSPAHNAIIDAAVEAGRVSGSALLAPDAFVVAADPQSVTPLLRQLTALGHTPQYVPSPMAAAAWLHERTVAVLADQDLVEIEGWNFLQFVRDAWPHIRRVVIAKEIHSFRLNLALRAGLVDAVIQKPFRAAALASKLGAGELDASLPRRKMRRTG